MVNITVSGEDLCEYEIEKSMNSPMLGFYPLRVKPPALGLVL